MKYLSLTKLAKELSEENNVHITFNMLNKALIANGYISEDGKNITERGKKLGICKHRDPETHTSWLVYGNTAKDFLAKHIDIIMARYANTGKGTAKKPTTNTAKDNSSNKKSVTKNTECSIYPYLGIPDNFVILDTETTGFENTDVVIELGIIDNNGKALYQSHFDTDIEINAFAAKCNHLTKASLKGKPHIKDEWLKIREVLKDKVIVGHNIPFDERLLLQSLKYEGIDAEEEIKKFFANCKDTQVIAKKFINSKSYSLNNLTTLIGITREEQHNAVDDCIMTKEFMDKLEELIDLRVKTNFMKV